MSGLTSDQRAFYLQQGYLILENIIPAEVFQPLIDELNQRIDQKAKEANKAGRLSNLFEDEPFERRMARICDTIGDVQDNTAFWPFSGEKYKSPAMFAIMTHHTLLDIVESIIGPEILAHPQFNLRAKLPHQDMTVVPWHQDARYLNSDAEETDMVNCWMPLVDATVENGCMEVIAGSHEGPSIDHEQIQGYQGLSDDSLPPGDHIVCPVRFGGVLLTKHKTIHRSLPNTSDHIRWSLDLRYSDPSQPTGRDNVPGFIARSKKQGASVARSLNDWLKLFEEL